MPLNALPRHSEALPLEQDNPSAARPAYEKPELKVLPVSGTAGKPFPSVAEFSTFTGVGS